MFHFRVVDVAATLPNDVKVFLNGEKIQIRGFREYVQAFSGASASDILFRNPSSRWNVAVSMRNADSNLPGAVSFVNNVATTKGGIHVDYVMDRLIEILKPAIDEKINNPSKNDTGKKTGVKPLMIKSNLSLFVNCFIENPSFDSQTKEVLTTKSKNFGSSFEFDRKELLTWANRSGFVDSIIDQLKNRKITQKSVKSKPESLSDIVKLEDAEWAGNSDAKKSSQCTLLVTEGDSAKALALSGLEVLGREKFGVFPLRGKVVNVSQLDEAKVRENAEINNLMRILGLRFEENYESAASRESLRYGKLMILADQDEDGSHIKGLIINFIHKFWPKLLATEFICAFRTPLLKAKRANETIPFYFLRDFRKWQENLNEKEARKYTIKYYKGLGTSTAVEARQYFSNLDHHVVK
ncbi:unnamed protein product [Caenorhabditis auriculariae]|uniref:DNA topoisomerase 2 n=1 Tax=Caenorhabditis auriculariae TaxID=2777116 RepID=A0A8S1GWW8_9PELO|nr:unnamed protein product [Caenorhabditis auriculariae]